MKTEDRINSAIVTVSDLFSVAEEVHKLPEGERDWENRAVISATMFKDDPHKAMAIDSRLMAMSEMINTGKLPGWATPQNKDGSVTVAEPVWLATAEEPLIFTDTKTYFDETSFLNRVMACAEPEGNA